jgi:hypothetical protein
VGYALIMGNPRLLVAYTLGVALVLGVMASLATNSWWFLPVALGAHFLGSVFFFVFTMKRLEQGDKPDPVTEARLEAEEREGGKESNGGLTKSGRREDNEVVL